MNMMSVIRVDEVYRLESHTVCFRKKILNTQVLLKIEFTGWGAWKRKARNDFS